MKRANENLQVEQHKIKPLSVSSLKLGRAFFKPESSLGNRGVIVTFDLRPKCVYRDLLGFGKGHTPVLLNTAMMCFHAIEDSATCCLKEGTLHNVHKGNLL